MRSLPLLTALSALSLCAFAACSDTAPAVPDNDLVLDIGPEDPEAGKPMFDPALPQGAKEDTVVGRKGPAVTVDSGNTAVWEVRNQWADKTTAEARLAGIAWGANSGLTWDEKFAAWVQSLERSAGSYGGTTFTLTTPYGKTLPAPSLECAEAAMFLRATFASWYGLPFYMEGASAGRRIFLGHFGFIYEDGSRFGTTPNFKTAYRDHSNLAATWQNVGWPKDTTLRARALGGSQDDFQPALFDGARAGAYFDELFLNKRVGYFMIVLLSYYGSINLADPSNTFNVSPAAIRAGDPLVLRWQRNGIGHVYVTKKVDRIDEDRVSAEVVSGSMPRRQPVWESSAASQSAFLSEYAGGPGHNGDGQLYAALGGGLKRWRTPVNQSGRWSNVVPEADKAAFIDASNHTAIAARLDTFRAILGTLSPEEHRDTLLNQIEAQRQHLARYPASCAARTRREQAFTKLYALMADSFGLDRQAVDLHYRKLDDYVLAELTYNQSKTCCWNSTSSAMYEIIMDAAQVALADQAAGTCEAPPVFRNDNGYERFRAHAELLGRGAEWRAWTADETCPQANVPVDTIAPSQATAYCEIADALDGDGPTHAPGHDEFEPNNVIPDAYPLAVPFEITAQAASGDDDHFVLTLPARGLLTVTLDFVHADGDLDLELYSDSGALLGRSNSINDFEELQISREAGTVYIRVTLYSVTETSHPYTLKASFEAHEHAFLGADAFEPNDTRDEARPLPFGTHEDLTSCGDSDFYSVTLTRSELTIEATFRNSEGDLDLRLYDEAGENIGHANNIEDVERITGALPPGAYVVEVLRYGHDALGCQPYTLTVSER